MDDWCHEMRCEMAHYVYPHNSVVQLLDAHFVSYFNNTFYVDHVLLVCERIFLLSVSHGTSCDSMFFQFLIVSLFCQKYSRNLWRPGIHSFTMSQNCICFFKEELEFPTSNGLALRESTMSWSSTFLDPVWKIYSIIVTGNSLWSRCWCLLIN